MSATFMWELVQPDRANHFTFGTSSDYDALHLTFPDGTVSTKDVLTLLAMHRATHSAKSLWSEIGDTLQRLQGNDFDKEVTIKIWTEY